MTIVDLLNELCAGFPACTAVAYCDLRTGTVLCSSSHQKLPQEQMDQLGLTAADLLNEAPDLTGPVRSAVLVQGGSISLFMRATLHSTEALCCDCSLEIDVLALGIAAEQVLITLGAAA